MTALVTGASRGIGRAIALRLAAAGVAIAVNYRERREAAELVVEQILRAGGRACALRADTGDAEQVASMVDEAAATLGAIGILVNNAGILHRGSLEDFQPEAMEAMYRTNVAGVIHCTRAVMHGMRPDGRIVNLSFIAAAGTSAQGTTYYAATKAAVESLTRRFALELGPSGIRVNAVAPGFILTDMAAEGSPEQLEERIAAMANKSVLGRVGQPEDVAEAIAFLVSDAARFITGQVLTVDGGRTDFLSR